MNGFEPAVPHKVRENTRRGWLCSDSFLEAFTFLYLVACFALDCDDTASLRLALGCIRFSHGISERKLSRWKTPLVPGLGCSGARSANHFS
eukprot:3584642-Amphidinium_carterae.1